MATGTTPTADRTATRTGDAQTAEHDRIAVNDSDGRRVWEAWGPYVAERAWGTVREDYSEHGEAWEHLPHDHARSRAYRWNEDGMAGVCDRDQTWCLALALWNGEDPILKERMFGLTGNEGNHAEDVKDYWWYTDGTPSHAWLSWRYHYPQRRFPYDELVAENRRRGKHEPEFELVDTGVFDDDRFWVVEVDYAKAETQDLLMRVRVTNAGPDTAVLHVLPTLWYRNTWSWGIPDQDRRPEIRRDGSRLLAQHEREGTLTLVSRGDGTTEPRPLFCDNDTNTVRLYGLAGAAHPKDAINDHVVHGADTVNPAETGTKAAVHHRLEVPPGETREVRVRLAAGDREELDLDDGFDEVVATRLREADEYIDALATEDLTDDERLVLRQAVAGMLWGKQFYHYDVEEWLDGDPGHRPPDSRRHGRNSGWRHLNNHDVISMPDPWEYPWYATWDLAFHCVPLAHVHPAFAKDQLELFLREWYMHPNGQLPAYEWAFDDVNPPVHAWAALRVFYIDGEKDYAFLRRVFNKLLINFTWWVNRKDMLGNNVFEGGFLGLDNIGPIDRSAPLPVAAHLEQSDGTAWMAGYCLVMLEIALLLAEEDPDYQDMATKFFEHFAYIADAIRTEGLWDPDDGFFYDRLRFDDGTATPLKVRSMVGLMPLMAVTTLGTRTLEKMPDFAARFFWFLENKPQYCSVVGRTHMRGPYEGRLLAIAGPEKMTRIVSTMLDEDEFLSPHGIRALSRCHRDNPFELQLAGETYTVRYEPAESTSGLFGGNSNWRGPVWFPVNHMMVEALRRYARFLGDDVRVAHPTGSSRTATLDEVADDLAGRLVALFLRDESGRRPVFGEDELFQTHPRWRDLVPFYEYFHGDTGRGLGASHQTGWTGLVVDLLLNGHRRIPDSI